MGLFSRKDSASEAPSTRSRPMVSSEAQAAELRARARRRLAGAIALVLAAVIVLPMILDSEPVAVSDDIPIRIPERGTPYQPPVSDPQAALAQNGAAAGSADAGGGESAVPPDLSGAQPPAGQTPAPAVTPGQPGPQAGATPPAVQPVTPPPVTTPSPPKPPETKPAATPAPKPADKPETTRSDDGARALALLEGRATPAPAASATAKPAASGNFVLQVASYTTQADANARRGKLHQAGVTNAFVEQASINGKQQFRLRVGPFPSREAAQAAQARLRTLGYDNGFIAAQ